MSVVMSNRHRAVIGRGEKSLLGGLGSKLYIVWSMSNPDPKREYNIIIDI